MTTNLRDRRRHQTAREIQLAALQLSLRIGYGAVTTDSIASEAGVSPRTFFNYYHNKQAALLGEAPELDCDCVSWIVTSDQPLAADLARLLGSMFEHKDPDRRMVQMIGQVWDSTPELMAVFRKSMDDIAQVVAGLLHERFGPGHEAEAMMIADLATHALSHAVRAWAADEGMDVGNITALIERNLRAVSLALT